RRNSCFPLKLWRDDWGRLDTRSVGTSSTWVAKSLVEPEKDSAALRARTMSAALAPGLRVYSR
ncbi:hypothetical protein GGI09_009041, partial [Coemansia sp. S100]